MENKIISIEGIVQGIGFRPFICNLAVSLSLKGWVKNNSNGIEIYIHGLKNNFEKFMYLLKNEPPVLSYITKINIEDCPNYNPSDFVILKSEKADSPHTFISPDIGICHECLEEILDSKNHRFNYPFTNCTNCGPRYSIIKSIPYDRPSTTMSTFTQCTSCYNEYSDHNNRRFHAQPNCCPACGPHIFIKNNIGIDITENITKQKLNSSNYNTNLLTFLGNSLLQGDIWAIKGLTGFHLCCNGENEKAIEKLRKRKKRKSKPFSIMVNDLSVLDKLCYVNEIEKEVLTSPRKPIVLLRKKENIKFPKGICDNNSFIGVMLPYTPLHHLIFSNNKNIKYLIMTSGNLSGLPIEYTNKGAEENLSPFVDYFLLHNRDIHFPVDDSIVTVVNKREILIRRARGYAPRPIYFETSKKILALGSDLKNTFSLSQDNYIFPSQYLGDLKNYETLKRREFSLSLMENLFGIKPEIIAKDAHPNYVSNNLYRYTSLMQINIQHHHAHVASVLVDNNFTSNVIGIAFDGTGYGDDGAIWGSEFFICDLKVYKRVGHLDYVNFLGGDKNLLDCSKSAISYLTKLTTRDEYKDDILNFTKNLYNNLGLQIYELINNNFNTYPSSSMGRLFDAIASLLNLNQVSSFEGEGAIHLQSISYGRTDCYYNFELFKNSNGEYVLSPELIIYQVILDINNNIPKELIGAKFHETISRYILEMCLRLREEYKINAVCLSGGVFQNALLLERSINLLEKNNFTVLLNRESPINDGGISIGQLAIANESF